MITRQWLLSLTLLVSSVSSVSGQERRTTTFSVEPELGYAAGNTQYQITYTQADSSGNLYGIRSKLVFPLDGLVSGLRLRLNKPLTPRHRLGAAFGAFIPVTNPGVLMTDEDWERIYPGPENKVGFTQSHAKVSGVLVVAEGSYGFEYPTGPSWDIMVGFRYQRSVQDMYDFFGWYADSTGSIYSVSEQVHALYYRVTFVTPSIGIRMTSGKPGRTQFRLEGAFAPTHMSDYDNHLLRNKESKASAWGIGGLGSAGVRIYFRHRGRRASYLDLSTRFFYSQASMTQTQHWYGDDPITPTRDETGVTVSGIPYSIKTIQYGINARFGIEF